MEVIAICIVGIITAFLSVMLKKHNPEYSIAVGIAAGILIIGVLLEHITGAISHIRQLLVATKIPLEYIEILFKTLGICFLTQFASDVCKDAGETALSSKIETAGKVIILIISLPLFERITSIALELIE